MKFFLKYLMPLLAMLWLVRVHPLGAALAVLLCVIRCAFKSHVLSHLFAMFVHDVIVVLIRWGWRLIFSRGRGWK